jgi:hypothetical protein
MKTFIFIALIMFFSYISHSFANDHASVHGMLVLGKDKIYLSHLPMFHSPHDYQAILEVKLDQASESVYSSLRSQGDGLVTLVPEPFVLPDMLAHPKPFSADLYLGHFERGGSLKATKVMVIIQKVILARKISPLEEKASLYEGFIFGEKNDLYLSHIIRGRPDFDQFFSIKGPLKAQGFVNFPGSDPRGFLTPGETNSSLGMITVGVNLYTETDDLSH